MLLKSYLSFIVLYILFIPTAIIALKCYQCISRSGVNQPCERPPSYHLTDCYVKTFYGTQEAGKYCISMRSVSQTSKEPVLIRTCTVEKPPDCGRIAYETEIFDGCPQICTFDGCNSGEPPAYQPMVSNAQYGANTNTHINQYPNTNPTGAYPGANPYGQPIGQTPYGQTPFGQPPYGGQTTYGPNEHGSTGYGGGGYYDQYSRGHRKTTSVITSVFSLAGTLVALYFMGNNDGQHRYQGHYGYQG